MSSKNLKQVCTKFAKPRRKFTLSLQTKTKVYTKFEKQWKSLHKVWKNKKKSLHEVWKTQNKFTQSLNSTEKCLHKVYTKFEKQQKKFTQSLRWANCVNLCKQIAKFTRFCPPMLSQWYRPSAAYSKSSYENASHNGGTRRPYEVSA